MALLEVTDVTFWELLGRLGAGLGLGAAVGIERELDGHDAGVRTHALLSLGAALFGALSVGAWGDFVVERAASNVQIDPTRIASYVVAGVGFLAGGAIIKQADRVRGLTTASSLWVTTAIGLACGIGFYAGALIATLAALVMLLLDRPIRKLTLRGGNSTVEAAVRSPDDVPRARCRG